MRKILKMFKSMFMAKKGGSAPQYGGLYPPGWNYGQPPKAPEAPAKPACGNCQNCPNKDK